jgi:hypothetical protein
MSGDVGSNSVWAATTPKGACRKFHSMQVIGAGFGRTGTMSMQAALELLGYRCYHMKEIAKDPRHPPARLCGNSANLTTTRSSNYGAEPITKTLR